MTKPDIRTSTLPERFMSALATDEPEAGRASLVEDGVHYDTKYATCIGIEQKPTDEGEAQYELYRGGNGRLFRRRIDRQSTIRCSDPTIAKVFVFVSTLIGTVAASTVGANSDPAALGEPDPALARAWLVFCGSIIIGSLLYPAFFYARLGLYRLLGCSEPMQHDDEAIEPLSCAELLSNPKSAPERRLARTIRDNQPTWKSSTGTVTKLPNGSWLYEHDSGRAGCSDREGLKEVIERKNDHELYRRLFDGDYERA